MKPIWKYILIAAILVVMALDVRTYLVWKAEASKLEQLADQLGLTETDPQAVEEALKDPDSVLARMWLARALYRQVESALGDSAQRPQLIEPLEHVHDIALGVWQERPVSCEAAAMTGSTRYLAWSLANDRRLITEAPAWEQPLQAARELCPKDPSHVDFLGGAYLELWFYLSDEKKQIAQEIVAEALLRSDRLTSLWLATASSREEAWELLPPRPSLWLEVHRGYAAAGEWLSAIEARERWREVSRLAAQESLVEAGARVAKGERATARGILGQAVFASLPKDVSSVALVQEALEIWPENPNPGREEAVLLPWLEWSLELCKVATCPLSTEAIARLGLLLPNLSEPQQGQVLLLGAQRAQAEVLEPSESEGAAWDSYWLTKAHVLGSAGDFEVAQEALLRTSESQRMRPLAWWLDSMASSNGLAGASTDFLLGPWRKVGHDWVQEIAVLSELSGLTVLLPEIQVLMEVELDGTRLGPFPPNYGSRLEMPQSLGAGPHRLVVRATEKVKLPQPRTEISGRS